MMDDSKDFLEIRLPFLTLMEPFNTAAAVLEILLSSSGVGEALNNSISESRYWDMPVISANRAWLRDAS